MEINLKNKKKLISLISFNINKLNKPNINKLFNRRNDAIKLVDDYGSTILEAKRKATEEEPKP